MTDFEEMYFKIFRACEQAIIILITTQRECEDFYIRAEPNPEFKPLTLLSEISPNLHNKQFHYQY